MPYTSAHASSPSKDEGLNAGCQRAARKEKAQGNGAPPGAAHGPLPLALGSVNAPLELVANVISERHRAAFVCS